MTCQLFVQLADEEGARDIIGTDAFRPEYPGERRLDPCLRQAKMCSRQRMAAQAVVCRFPRCIKSTYPSRRHLDDFGSLEVSLVGIADRHFQSLPLRIWPPSLHIFSPISLRTTHGIDHGQCRLESRLFSLPRYLITRQQRPRVQSKSRRPSRTAPRPREIETVESHVQGGNSTRPRPPLECHLSHIKH